MGNFAPSRQVYLTETELAERQNRSVRTIQGERLKGGGVPFAKFGRAVRYRLADIEAWETARTLNHTSTTGGTHA